MVKNVEKVNFIGLINLGLKEILIIIILKAKVLIIGKMEENIMVSGKIIRWKDGVFLHGLMVDTTKELI